MIISRNVWAIDWNKMCNVLHFFFVFYIEYLKLICIRCFAPTIYLYVIHNLGETEMNFKLDFFVISA